MQSYVHGYSQDESCRLQDQAQTLTQLLHHDTTYPAGSRVLEAGCGVGAQTVIISRNSPEANITSVDRSASSLDQARACAAANAVGNVTFEQADIFDLPYDVGHFDHVFVCFVLEHLPNPVEALIHLKRVLKPGGTITVIEGDHGSYYCHPASSAADRTVRCLVEIQARLNGNALIGRQLYPLLHQAGFDHVNVSPRMVYVDASKPDLVEGFTRNTFIAMVAGVKQQALEAGLIDETIWDRGILDLTRTTEADGTFCYTFFKGTATH